MAFALPLTSATAAVDDTSHRTQPVHDASTPFAPLPATPESEASTSWEVLPIATGAAGGILVVTIAYAAATGVRHRHERAHHAHAA
jgi:hypothetical protein